MEPESHALWNNRDIITAIMKCTHPEIHNSDKRALCLTSKLLKVCTNKAAKQKCLHSSISCAKWLAPRHPSIRNREANWKLHVVHYAVLCRSQPWMLEVYFSVHPQLPLPWPAHREYGREHEPHGAEFTRVALVLRSEDWSHAVQKMRYGRLESKCAEIRRLCM